jgi:cytochrome c-type biogenesis protein CcmH
MKKHLIVLLLLLTGSVTLYPMHSSALTRSEIEANLICYACPGEPLNIDRCGGGDQMRAAIDSMLAEGKGKKEILAYFVERFGDEILTAPPKRGFNLVAYAAPFVGFVIGAAFASVLVGKWAAAGRRRSKEEDPKADEPLDNEMQAKIQEELRKFEEEGP